MIDYRWLEAIWQGTRPGGHKSPLDPGDPRDFAPEVLSTCHVRCGPFCTLFHKVSNLNIYTESLNMIDRNIQLQYKVTVYVAKFLFFTS